MTRTILLAGLLGGLLGGAASFAAGRFIKPAEPARSNSEIATSEAREVADAFVAKLKAAKFEEFCNDAKANATFNSDEKEMAAFQDKLIKSRSAYVAYLGPSMGEFELLRTSALSPSLFRFVYLEKFEKGGVWWSFVLYRGKDSWKLVAADHGFNLASIFDNLS